MKVEVGAWGPGETGRTKEEDDKEEKETYKNEGIRPQKVLKSEEQNLEKALNPW